MTVAMNMVCKRVLKDALVLSSVSSVQKRSTMPVRITSGNSEMYRVVIAPYWCDSTISPISTLMINVSITAIRGTCSRW